MKACFKCGIIQPLDDFYKHSQMADGHLNKCKTCAKQDVHARRHGDGRESVLAYDRLRSKEPSRKTKAADIFKRWKQQHPERRSAQNKMASAIKSGCISAWPACALPDCTHKPEAHHPDYSNPLDVVWLCSAHHKQAHALARNQG